LNEKGKLFEHSLSFWRQQKREACCCCWFIDMILELSERNGWSHQPVPKKNLLNNVCGCHNNNNNNKSLKFITFRYGLRDRQIANIFLIFFFNNIQIDLI
jgi:hypothetical protein